MLAEYVEQCEAIVHFAGDMAGSMPAASSVEDLLKRRPELETRLAKKDLGRDALKTLTYTQWEAWLAIGFDKDLLIVEPAEGTARGPNYAPSEASRAAQAQHLKRLRAINRYPGPAFKNEDNLVAQIFGTAVIDALVKAAKTAGRRLALSNISIRVPEHFLGRDDALVEIDSALKRGEGRVAITTLHGMRGVGKTVLAAAYADRHRADYRATWWVRAETSETTRADLVSLGVRLGWAAVDDKDEVALNKVRERLRDEGEGLLLVYDNAIDAASVRPYLPSAGAAHVLVTSNTHAWRGVAAPVEIGVWPKEVGAVFLVDRVGQAGERSEAETLSEDLGGLPLAHEQAGAYCERLGVSFAGYRKRLEAAPAGVLDVDKDASADYHGGLTVAKTFALGLDEAARLHAAAEPLIVYAALLAPEPIPLWLFFKLREHLGEPLESQLAGEGLDEAIAALRVFALVDRLAIADSGDASERTDAIKLHRLVRIAAAARRQGEADDAVRRVIIETMADAYGQTEQLRQQIDTLAFDLVAGATLPPRGAEVPALFLLFGFAMRRRETLDNILDVLSHLGAIRGVGGDPARRDTELRKSLPSIRKVLERAIAVVERALGEDHPSVAVNLSLLAGLLEKYGDFPEARSIYQRALSIRKKAFWPEHADTVESLNDIALLLRYQGDIYAAQPLFERALFTFQVLRTDQHQLMDKLTIRFVEAFFSTFYALVGAAEWEEVMARPICTDPAGAI